MKNKFKKDFQEYYTNFVEEEWGARNIIFNILPFSMKYGVFVQFFDSVGIELMVKSWKEGGEDIFICSVHKLFSPSHYKNQEKYNTRQEAQEQCLLKAIEFYNKN